MLPATERFCTTGSSDEHYFFISKNSSLQDKSLNSDLIVNTLTLIVKPLDFMIKSDFRGKAIYAQILPL